MFDGAIVTKVGAGGNIGKLQADVYAAVGVRLVKNDTSSGGREWVGTDASVASSQSPCGADDAGAPSLCVGSIPSEDGEVAPPYNLTSSAGQIAPKRMRRETAQAQGSLAGLRGQLQEGVSNDKAQLEGGGTPPPVRYI